ncbi:MAG TPA: hypothetical protein V6D17_00410, partial [Candidatus Obscuribacterales bacterium]
MNTATTKRDLLEALRSSYGIGSIDRITPLVSDEMRLEAVISQIAAAETAGLSERDTDFIVPRS